MEQPLSFDLLAPAELLTYFVVLQLTAHHMSGQWLKAEDLAISAQRWPRLNGCNMTCLQRMKLAVRARHLAEHVERISDTTINEATKSSMLFGGLGLDFQSPALVQIYLTCTKDLFGGSSTDGKNPDKLEWQ
jgi:hypothetical protein